MEREEDISDGLLVAGLAWEEGSESKMPHTLGDWLRSSRNGVRLSG